MTDIRAQRSGSTLAGAIFGNYRILEPLSRGGMGSVFRAEHAVLGRPAAVKILRPELTTNAQLVQRFLNEAKAATLIRHPGIVEVYDYGTTPDGTSYLVMELLSGASLAQRIAERGRIPEVEAALITRGVASALKAAHREGIIHRDLKPDNIFLVPDPDGPTGERVKVLDFGIAKLIDPSRAHHTQTGALIGTPIYMAPEQARAASTIDHRADLYSLGCLLYEMLVGQPPFVAVGAGEIIAMHLFNAPHPPSRFVQVSPELERIVLRLLEKEPHDRFQHAGELIDALDALTGYTGRSAGVPAIAEARPLLADERVPDHREPRSSMGLVAGLITVGIAAAIAVFVATRGGGGDDAPGPAAGTGSDGSATATELAAPAQDAAQPPQPPRPPKEAGAPPPTTPRPPAHATARPKDPPPPRPTPGRNGKRPGQTKPDDASGPVTHPGGPVTTPDPGGPVTSPGGPITSPGGPVTSPAGPTTPKGSPVNPPDTLNEDKPPPPKPAEPPPKPAEPPPPPADKLPDKPPAEGAP